LDISKWNKSQSLRLDACGTFNYCTCCDMGLKFPCAHAYSKYFNEKFEGEVVETKDEIKVEVKEEKPAKKSCAKKTTSSTTTKKAESTNKATSKKTTTTKKTTKK
jgi:hypothetical protein